MLRITIIFLLLLNSLTGQTQKSYAFNDSLQGNILLFEKVHDTVVCVRSTYKGIQWNLFDSTLKPIENGYLKTGISSQVLIQQLKALPNSIGYIKQRIANNKFDICVKELTLRGEKSFDSLNVVYSEPYLGQSHNSLNFYFVGSPSNRFVLLYRFEKAKDVTDSLLMKAVVLDEHLNHITTNNVFVPVKQITESLLAIGVDDNGNVLAISGDKFESYVLGTHLNIGIFETKTNRWRIGDIKVPRHKLQNILIDATSKKYILYCTSSSSNEEREIDGLTTVSIDKTTFAYEVQTTKFSNEVKKEVGKIITAPNRSALNQMNWVSLDYANENYVLVASVKNAIRYNTPFRSTRTVSSFSPFQSGLSNLSTSLLSNRGNYFAAGSNSPQISDRFKRNYVETLLMLSKKDDELVMSPLYAKGFYTSLQLPKLFFVSSTGGKLVHSFEKRGKYQLAVSAMEDDKVVNTELIPGTVNCFIDPNISPLYINKQFLFVYKNGLTNTNVLMLVK
jgi:hypothetical protein